MAFIQIIEVITTRPEEIQKLVQQWSARTEGRRTVYRSTLTADRDRPDTYVQIVEFPSHQEAMTNSGLPETAEFADKLARLCDGPPVFRNLDVRRADEPHRGPQALPGPTTRPAVSLCVIFGRQSQRGPAFRASAQH